MSNTYSPGIFTNSMAGVKETINHPEAEFLDIDYDTSINIGEVVLFQPKYGNNIKILVYR